MKLRQWLAVVGSLSLICGMGSTQAAVIYTENFPNATGAAAALNSVGWLANHGTGGVAYNAASTSGANPLIDSAVGAGTNPGFLRMSSGIGVNEPVLIWTSEIQMSLTPIDDLATVSFSMRNQVANANIRLAVQVDSTWYVTTSIYNTATTTWTMQTVDFTTATWNSLTFTSGSSLSMGSAATLPVSGTVTSIGFFTDNKPSAYLSFDDVIVSTVPEPSAALCVGLAGLLVLRRTRLSPAA
jgi:hypothetical protein